MGIGSYMYIIIVISSGNGCVKNSLVAFVLFIKEPLKVLS